MNSLREIQIRCYEAFASADDSVPIGEFIDNDIPATTRVSVYRNNASETFRKTLASTFSVVEQLVGDLCFRSLATAFSHSNPSTSGDLQGFGAPFPGFLASLYDESEFSYLGDVARLELAIETALLLGNERALGIEALSDISETNIPSTRLTLVPSIQLLTSQFPILEIWRANQSGSEATVNLASGAQRLAIMRHGHEVEIHALDAASFELARQCASHRSLGEAFDAMSEAFGAELSRALRELFDKGCIAALHRGP